MPHLVNPLRNATYNAAIRELQLVHAFLVRRAGEEIASSAIPADRWGIGAKRLEVRLIGEGRTKYIGKPSERFGEVVNMTATIERMLALLQWCSRQPAYKGLRIRQCHPSTSDDAGGNDLVLVTREGVVKVRCEVCDVASSRASSNGKEGSDLSKLGCAHSVPEDGATRFICTAREFADALASSARKWHNYTYRYALIELGDELDTCLLRIIPPPMIAGGPSKLGRRRRGR
jgi:hypothetical protein